MNIRLLLFLGSGISMAADMCAQNIGINVNGASPHPSALLDIDASAIAGTKRGLLIPRVTSAERMAIVSPATGLMVFDTTANGFWYWDGTAWVPMTSTAGWGLLGNTGTAPATNFLGTTDNVPLVIRINAVERLRITIKGQLEPLNTGSSVFLGEEAGLNDDLTANRNVFVGMRSGRANTTGERNTFVGDSTGYGNTTGIANTFLGAGSGRANTTGSQNTFVGTGTGFLNTTGQSNTFVGRSAGRLNTTGSENTAVGLTAGFSATTAVYNTMLGAHAGEFTTTGGLNTFLGTSAGRSNTTGGENTLVGLNAGYNSTTAQHNTTVGAYGGFSNTTGNNLTLVGWRSGYANTTGINNVMVGSSAGESNTTGQGNTFIGHTCGRDMINGNGNTFLGANCGGSSSGGSLNTILGADAGQQLNTGSENSIVGYSAGVFVSSGTGNCLFGTEAGLAVTTGSNNTYLGTGADGTAALTNSSAIGYNAQVTTSNSMVLGGTGADAVHVGIGVTSPTAELEVNGYTKLGSNAPAVKMLKLTTTTAPSQGGSVNVAHGLTPAKILAVDVLIEYSPGQWVPTAYTGSLGYMCNFYINGGSIVLWNLSGASASILSKPVKILVTYEE